MYCKKEPRIYINEYMPAFSGTLNINNRWVRMAELIPREEFQDKYASKFEKTGNIAYPLRMGTWHLDNQGKEKTSNEKTRSCKEQIPEYFMVLHDFTNEAPFDQSAVTRFAQRLGSELIKECV